MGMGLAIEGHVTLKYGKVKAGGVGLKWALVAQQAPGALALVSATKKRDWIPLPKRPPRFTIAAGETNLKRSASAYILSIGS